jgi:serine/threonine protein phosphatase PrpC
LSGELRWGSRTRSGNDPLKRRKENQDSLCVADGLLENKSITLFTVFDGHGPQGAFASHFVRNEYHHCLSETLQELARSSIKQNNNNSQETYKFSTSNLGQLIPESLRQASKRVNEKLMHQSSIDVTVSGSTCVSLLVCDQQAFLANVGDSRAIFAQYSSVEHAYSIVAQTKDHKPDIPEEKERIEAKNGRVFEWGTFRVWLKDIDMPGLAMSRSFGDAVAKTIGVTCEPDIFPVETLVKGDNNQDYPNFAVLASDGLWEFMATDEVVEFVSACIISSQKSPQETCDLLVKEALDRWNEEEDIVDDISVIVVYF